MIGILIFLWSLGGLVLGAALLINHGEWPMVENTRKDKTVKFALGPAVWLICGYRWVYKRLETYIRED